MSVDNAEKIQDHPTWRMLEKAKKVMRDILDGTAPWDPMYELIEYAHQTLTSLQYKFESKFYKDR